MKASELAASRGNPVRDAQDTMIVQDSPTISVLIPVFNWDIRSLVTRIMAEVEGSALDEAVELLVMDDSSTDAQTREANDILLESKRAVPYLRILTTDRNLGRSAARNLLACTARGEYLLFLDCDTMPDGADFIGTYLHYAADGVNDVVCGGISYMTRVRRGNEYDFHQYFGTRKEAFPARRRNLSPWRHLLTSNIMVRKSVYLANPFNEGFTGYGYEDVEWGIRLAAGHSIIHIDNTASHLGLVTKKEAYGRMRDSVPNYLLLRRLHPKAFISAPVGKCAGILRLLPDTALSFCDLFLRRMFLCKATCGYAAFLLFQLNFAVLLARGLKKG